MTEPIDVLVVDDEAGMRLTLKGILSRKGYNVTLAENGPQALEAMKKKSFRIVLMDIKMPGMSGVETFMKIKTFDANVTVIMMTGYALEDEIKKAIQEGAYSVLSKPLDMNKALDLINEGLSSQTLVMMVDELEDDRLRLKTALEQKGYKVVEVKNSDECLQQVKDRKFQVIILDANARREKSLEMFKQLKEIRPDVSVVMVTGHDIEDWLERAIKEGSLATLQKPVNIDKLLEIVASCSKHG